MSKLRISAFAHTLPLLLCLSLFRIVVAPTLCALCGYFGYYIAKLFSRRLPVIVMQTREEREVEQKSDNTVKTSIIGVIGSVLVVTIPLIPNLAASFSQYAAEGSLVEERVIDSTVLWNGKSESGMITITIPPDSVFVTHKVIVKAKTGNAFYQDLGLVGNEVKLSYSVQPDGDEKDQKVSTLSLALEVTRRKK